MAAGRPSEYNEDTFSYIIKQMQLGRSVNAICKEEDMPSRVTFYAWIDKDPELLNKYTRAMEQRADAIFDNMLDIADNSEKDVVVLEGGREVVDHNVINRDKLKIDTRKWILARMNPKKYGDSSKLDVTTGGEKIQERTIKIHVVKQDENKEGE